MLSTSPFEFVVRHFFWLLLSVMAIDAVNGLFFFPILLSLVGPGAEIIPLQHENRISTPSPPPKRSTKYSNNKYVLNNSNSKRSSSSRSSSSSSSCSKSHHHHNTKHSNVNNEPSLTTITEEPQSWQSSASTSSIGSGINNPRELQSIVVQPEVTVETHHHGGDHQNTKVTATANIKVELVTPGGRTRTYHSS